ncbi:hypothetical protein HQQ81_21760 [Microbacteriaceae bacterium VKM Ac-2854]|nr:hypothetical protein [Microbacteriaceae bacterium VKM Ac-2854]
MRQGITFGIERDGLIPFSGCMTRLQYETVLSTIGTFTNPRLQQPNTGCDDTPESESTETPSSESIQRASPTSSHRGRSTRTNPLAGLS